MVSSAAPSLGGSFVDKSAKDAVTDTSNTGGEGSGGGGAPPDLGDVVDDPTSGEDNPGLGEDYE